MERKWLVVRPRHDGLRGDMPLVCSLQTVMKRPRIGPKKSGN